MWHSRPPLPFMAKTILNFHFDYLNPSLSNLHATKDLLLREDVVPPHLDHQRAFLLCLRASGDTFSNDDTFRTGTQVILCWSKGAA